MPSYTLDLDRRADALIELLGCPVRWSSRQYVMAQAGRLMARCDSADRPDLTARIREKVAGIKIQ
jgi:hypothetical protein